MYNIVAGRDDPESCTKERPHCFCKQGRRIVILTGWASRDLGLVGLVLVQEQNELYRVAPQCKEHLNL